MARQIREAVFDDQGDLIGYLIAYPDGDVLVTDARGNEVGVARSLTSGRKLLQNISFNERHYFSRLR